MASQNSGICSAMVSHVQDQGGLPQPFLTPMPLPVTPQAPSCKASPKVIVKFTDIRHGLTKASLSTSVEEANSYLESPKDINFRDISKTLCSPSPSYLYKKKPWVHRKPHVEPGSKGTGAIRRMHFAGDNKLPPKHQGLSVEHVSSYGFSKSASSTEMDERSLQPLDQRQTDVLSLAGEDGDATYLPFQSYPYKLEELGTPLHLPSTLSADFTPERNAFSNTGEKLRDVAYLHKTLNEETANEFNPSNVSHAMGEMFRPYAACGSASNQQESKSHPMQYPSHQSNLQVSCLTCPSEKVLNAVPSVFSPQVVTGTYSDGQSSQTLEVVTSSSGHFIPIKNRLPSFGYTFSGGEDMTLSHHTRPTAFPQGDDSTLRGGVSCIPTVEATEQEFYWHDIDGVSDTQGSLMLDKEQVDANSTKSFDGQSQVGIKEIAASPGSCELSATPTLADLEDDADEAVETVIICGGNDESSGGTDETMNKWPRHKRPSSNTPPPHALKVRGVGISSPCLRSATSTVLSTSNVKDFARSQPTSVLQTSMMRLAEFPNKDKVSPPKGKSFSMETILSPATSPPVWPKGKLAPYEMKNMRLLDLLRREKAQLQNSQSATQPLIAEPNVALPTQASRVYSGQMAIPVSLEKCIDSEPQQVVANREPVLKAADHVGVDLRGMLPAQNPAWLNVHPSSELVDLTDVRASESEVGDAGRDDGNDSVNNSSRWMRWSFPVPAIPTAAAQNLLQHPTATQYITYLPPVQPVSDFLPSSAPYITSEFACQQQRFSVFSLVPPSSLSHPIAPTLVAHPMTQRFPVATAAAPEFPQHHFYHPLSYPSAVPVSSHSLHPSLNLTHPRPPLISTQPQPASHINNPTLASQATNQTPISSSITTSASLSSETYHNPHTVALTAQLSRQPASFPGQNSVNSSVNKTAASHGHQDQIRFLPEAVCKKRPPKPKHFSLHTLAIGSFTYSAVENSTPKVKVIFSKRRLLYEMEWAGDLVTCEDGGRARLFCCIEIPLSSIVGLCGEERFLYVEVDTKPLMLMGSKPCDTAGRFINHKVITYKRHQPLDLTNNQLSTIPYHQILLTQPKANKVIEALCQFDERFELMAKQPLVLDPTKTLPNASLCRTSHQSSAPCKSADEDSGTASLSLMPNRSLPSPGLSPDTPASPPCFIPSDRGESCSCKTACQFSHCPCVQRFAACTSLCACSSMQQNCMNPVNQFYTPARLAQICQMQRDPCLMANIFKMTDFMAHLNKKVTLPCCNNLVSLESLVPGKVECPHAEHSGCTAIYQYSWCTGKLHNESLSPRQHCVVCSCCTNADARHCKSCDKCYTPQSGVDLCPCQQSVGEVTSTSLLDAFTSEPLPQHSYHNRPSQVPQSYMPGHRYLIRGEPKYVNIPPRYQRYPSPDSKNPNQPEGSDHNGSQVDRCAVGSGQLVSIHPGSVRSSNIASNPSSVVSSQPL